MSEREKSESHCIRVLYEAHYPHASGKYTGEVLGRGDGTLEHWLQVFRAALVNAGFSIETAKRLQIDE